MKDEVESTTLQSETRQKAETKQMIAFFFSQRLFSCPSPALTILAFASVWTMGVLISSPITGPSLLTHLLWTVAMRWRYGDRDGQVLSPTRCCLCRLKANWSSFSFILLF